MIRQWFSQVTKSQVNIIAKSPRWVTKKISIQGNPYIFSFLTRYFYVPGGRFKNTYELLNPRALKIPKQSTITHLSHFTIVALALWLVRFKSDTLAAFTFWAQLHSERKSSKKVRFESDYIVTWHHSWFVTSRKHQLLVLWSHIHVDCLCTRKLAQRRSSLANNNNHEYRCPVTRYSRLCV